MELSQPRLRGALSLKRKGPLKGDSRKTRVVKGTLVGPVTQNLRKRNFSSADCPIFKKAKKVGLGPRLELSTLDHLHLRESLKIIFLNSYPISYIYTPGDWLWWIHWDQILIIQEPSTHWCPKSMLLHSNKHLSIAMQKYLQSMSQSW